MTECSGHRLADIFRAAIFHLLFDQKGIEGRTLHDHGDFHLKKYSFDNIHTVEWKASIQMRNVLYLALPPARLNIRAAPEIFRTTPA